MHAKRLHRITSCAGPTHRMAGLLVVLAAMTLAPQSTWAEPTALALTFPPPLAENVSSLPRVVAQDAVMRRINTSLAERDRAEQDWVLECNSDPPRSIVERSVEVAFVGPRYFALVVADAFSCPGAAHPNDFVLPLTFDLTTGLEVDWRNLFPKHLLRTEAPATGFDGVIGSAALTDLYLSVAVTLDQDCRDEIVGNDGYFHVWPSARDRGLILMPAGLAHAMRACADPVVLPVTLLRAAGFLGDLPASLTDPAALAGPD